VRLSGHAFTGPSIPGLDGGIERGTEDEVSGGTFEVDQAGDGVGMSDGSPLRSLRSGGDDVLAFGRGEVPKTYGLIGAAAPEDVVVGSDQAGNLAGVAGEGFSEGECAFGRVGFPYSDGGISTSADDEFWHDEE